MPRRGLGFPGLGIEHGRSVRLRRQFGQIRINGIGLFQSFFGGQAITFRCCFLLPGRGLSPGRGHQLLFRFTSKLRCLLPPKTTTSSRHAEDHHQGDEHKDASSDRNPDPPIHAV